MCTLFFGTVVDLQNMARLTKVDGKTLQTTVL